MDDQRTDVPKTGDERGLLRACLDFHRETLALRCSGLADEDIATARDNEAAAPSLEVTGGGRGRSTRSAGCWCT